MSAPQYTFEYKQLQKQTIQTKEINDIWNRLWLAE